jgi:immunity protein Imm1 of predicted polymorphic toxin system
MIEGGVLVSYGEGPKEVHVATVQELDELLDRVQEQARSEGRPLLVDINVTDDRLLCLGMTVDGELSMVSYDDMESGVALLSRGTSDSGGQVEFFSGNQYSYFPARALISSQTAREAAREFLRTGRPSTAVDWHQTP